MPIREHAQLNDMLERLTAIEEVATMRASFRQDTGVTRNVNSSVAPRPTRTAPGTGARRGSERAGSRP